MIADWWPDDWDYPVGYHVTVPCEAEDAAYRSFHQAFGYSGTDGSGAPVLTYQHDLLRDGGLVDRSFGANGLCRSTNWGMEAFRANTMRYCTRGVAGDYEDYTVYWGPAGPPDNESAWAAWQCSGADSELPWPDATVSDAANTATHESALYSLGTLPNMPPSGADFYPYDLTQDMYDPGPWQDILAQQGWGPGCSDYPLLYCATDWDCPTGAYRCRGRFCRNSYIPCQSSADCAGTGYGDCEGVCIENTVQCIKHSECPGGMMCTGLGECVTPVLTVQNKVQDTDFAFQVNANNGQCPAGSSNHSMLGASYWAYVTSDVLRLHGMCSYGDWYKYQTTLQRCNPVDKGDHWEIDPTQCYYIDLEAQTTNASHWWEYTASHPTVMYMHPSNCDRDYERLKGFQSCAPAAASLRLAGQDITASMAYDRYAKMHMGSSPGQGGVRVPIAKMPFSSDPKFGFLGIPGIRAESDISSPFFEPCSNIDQCTPSPFTVLGAPAKRRLLQWGTWTPVDYTDNDAFKCGVMGYAEADHCRLDMAVLQLYRFLCVEPAGTNGRCARLIGADLTVLCSAVAETYSAGYGGVAANVLALNDILYAVPSPYDLESYLDTTDCMADLWGYMNAPGQLYSQPYLVMDFALFEMSFDWYYQCIVMTPTRVDTSSGARQVQDCQAYLHRDIYAIENYKPRSSTGDDAMTMLKFVRGGYRREDVQAFLDTHVAYARGNLSQVKAGIVDSVYGGEDTSYPRCSTDKRWRMGPKYGQPYLHEFRALIDTL